MTRATFTTSRLLDFFSEKELVAQTGHPASEWPLVVVKELVDNALDACEEAGVAPEIEVVADHTGITVADNGAGIPPETVADVIDFAVRVSSREAFVAPDRGAQGNALKTLVAMPFVLDGSRGRVTITARGVRHEITASVDRVRQEPIIEHVRCPAVDVNIGTRVTVGLPDSACSNRPMLGHRFLQLCEGFAWLNPHLRLVADWRGEKVVHEPTNTGWVKWTPAEPTSPHWYGVAHLERLIAAYVAHPEHAMSVRDFVTQFRGLTGSAKGREVLSETGMARTTLADLVVDGALDTTRTIALLAAMQRHSRPVKAAQLGVIGRDHLAERCALAGCEMDSFEYKRTFGESDGVPWVLECAFAWRPDADRYHPPVTGINWSPGIGNPFRVLGREGLSAVLQRQRAVEDCVVVVHLTHPRVGYTDRGKSAVALNDDRLTVAVVEGVESVTKRWAKQIKAEEREVNARARRRDAMTKLDKGMSFKAAASMVMEDAYLAASAGGTLPASARQVMYAARPRILALTGKKVLDDVYFTQTLLPDFIAEHGLEDSWDVVFDARGHLVEPHTDRAVPLGTLGVRHYLSEVAHPPRAGDHAVRLGLDYPTCGPVHRYSAVLFIEKEGFMPLLQAVRLPERYDVAVMSTKGMSNVAARRLVDQVCHEHARLFVVHDFDKDGFSIAATLASDTRRYEFTHDLDVVDLGLRLGDVEDYDLQSEPVPDRSDRARVEANLAGNGATPEEIAFLDGRRVELNAFTSDDFVDWLQRKLTDHGVGKVVPDERTLVAAYRRAVAVRSVNAQLDVLMSEAVRAADLVEVPADIADRIRSLLDDDRHTPWDEAVARVARQPQHPIV